jgi:hypothetical protein
VPRPVLPGAVAGADDRGGAHVRPGQVAAGVGPVHGEGVALAEGVAAVLGREGVRVHELDAGRREEAARPAHDHEARDARGARAGPERTRRLGEQGHRRGPGRRALVAHGADDGVRAGGDGGDLGGVRHVGRRHGGQPVGSGPARRVAHDADDRVAARDPLLGDAPPDVPARAEEHDAHVPVPPEWCDPRAAGE